MNSTSRRLRRVAMIAAIGVAGSACTGTTDRAPQPDRSLPAPTATVADPSTSTATTRVPSAPEVVQRASRYLTRARSAEIKITQIRSGSVHHIVGDLAGTRTKRVVSNGKGGTSRRITLGQTSYVNGDVAFWRGRGEKLAVARRLSREYLEIAPDERAADMSLRGELNRAFGVGSVAQRLRTGEVQPVRRRGSPDLVRLVASGHTLEVVDDGTYRPVSLTTDAGSDAEERWAFLGVGVPVGGITAPPPAAVYRPTRKN